MNTLIDFLAEARSAHQRNDWRASYAAFVRADGLGAMPTDDLEAYSAAAWRSATEMKRSGSPSESTTGWCAPIPQPRR